MDFREYLRLLRIHWLPLTLGLLLGTLGSLGWSLLQPKVYTAESQALVTVTDSAGTGPSLSSESLARNKVASFVEIGSWRRVAESAANSLQLSDSPESLVKRVKVTTPTDTTILSVSASAATPEGARDLAEAWVRGMIDVIQEVEGNPSESGGITVTPGDSARLPTSPSSPNIRANVAIGALVGLALAFGYVLVKTVLDRRIRTPQAIEQHTELSVLGTLPLVAEAGKSGSSLLPMGAGSETSKDMRLLAEATRELRTNLQYTNIDNPVRAVVMTSPLPGDGKSTTASNLAIVLAQSGQRVVLVDTDLRRPRIAELLGLSNDAGLTDVLAGRADVEDVRHSIDPNGMLTVITSGRIPPNPSEVLGSKRMLNLVEELSREATVILDSPPLAPVTDAAILAAQTDGAILVVGTGKTTIEALQHATDSLHKVNATPLGVVMNRVPTKGVGRASYGYEYRTYYGKSYETTEAQTTEAIAVEAQEHEEKARPARALSEF